MYYDEDTVTDQPMRQIAAEMIREKALRRLQEEIPHGIAVTIEQMKERPDGSVMVSKHPLYVSVSLIRESLSARAARC